MSQIGGFRIDNYFIALPEKDFIVEDKDGNMHILVDIYTIDGDNIKSKIPESEITPELEVKISAYINEILLQAIEAEEAADK